MRVPLRYTFSLTAYCLRRRTEWFSEEGLLFVDAFHSLYWTGVQLSEQAAFRESA
jgi:hypothetical protein